MASAAAPPGLEALNGTIANDDSDGGSLLDRLQSSSAIADLAITRFGCWSCHHPCEEVTQCHGAVRCFSALDRTTYSGGAAHRTRGCIKDVDRALMFCGSRTYKSPDVQFAFHCCEGHNCNDGEFPPLPVVEPVDVSDTAPGTARYHGKLVAAVLAPVLVLVLVLLLLAWLWRRRQRRALTATEQKAPMLGGGSQLYEEEMLRARQTGDSTLREVLEHSMTSGSGSGLPLLIQRTLAKELTLEECVGNGRYGQVWRGVWQGENVAVKIFYSRDEASWSRETEIYNTTMLRHANILGYLGSDMASRNSCTQLLLVAHYHPLGSLYDHLSRQPLTLPEALRLLVTAVNGVNHLHTEVHGTQGKPAIAHRDLKTKNILVKTTGECVIADLGLAVTHKQGLIDLGNNLRVGTKRYMPPEVLDETLNKDSFESFLKADMYALGLVMWEVARRCTAGGRAEPYRPPFHDVVPADPSFEEIRKIVCVDQHRPIIPNHWSGHQTLVGIAKLMKECWHHNPMVRLSALRLKKSLVRLEGTACGVKPENVVKIDV